MTNLTDLKRNVKKEKKEKMNMAAAPMDNELYPYGTKLTFGTEELDKLGMKSLPKVGTKVRIEAIGEVVSVSQNESVKDDPRRNVEIQLQKISIEKGSSSVKDAIDDGIADAKD